MVIVLSHCCLFFTASAKFSSNGTVFVKDIRNGTYHWNCEACDTLDFCAFGSINRTLKVNFTCMTVNRTSGVLQYSVNYSRINWTDIFTPSVFLSGNYTWNMTEFNITPHNVTSGLFNITNNCLETKAVLVAQHTTLPWYTWNFANGTNITTSLQNIVNITVNSSRAINFTLSVLNISLTHVNWTAQNGTSNRSFWNISEIITFID